MARDLFLRSANVFFDSLFLGLSIRRFLKPLLDARGGFGIDQIRN
jgi:hypothetical protein